MYSTSTPVTSRSSATTPGYSRQLAMASSWNGSGFEDSPSGASSPAAALDASAPGVARSSTVTRQPAFASSYAIEQPMMPPPITTTERAIMLSRVRQGRT